MSTGTLFRRAAGILVPFVPSANLQRQTCADPAQFRQRPLLPGLRSGPGTAGRQRTRLELGRVRRGILSAPATDSVGGSTAQIRTAGLAGGTVLQEAPGHRRAVPRRDARVAAAGRRRGAGIEALRVLRMVRRAEEGITVPRGLEPRASQKKRTVGASVWRRWMVGDDGTAADSTGRSAVVADGLTPVDQRLQNRRGAVLAALSAASRLPCCSFVVVVVFGVP